MSESEVRWFRSKLDWWLGLILVALPIIEFGGLAVALSSGDADTVAGLAFGCAMVAAIYGLLVIPVRYAIFDGRLAIRFGIVRQYIELAAIREVYPTHNPLSSPALSLDRLAIRTGPGPFGLSLISPAEREEFLSLLAGSAGLVRVGDRLVRPSDEGPD